MTTDRVQNALFLQCCENHGDILHYYQDGLMAYAQMLRDVEMWEEAEKAAQDTEREMARFERRSWHDWFREFGMTL